MYFRVALSTLLISVSVLAASSYRINNGATISVNEHGVSKNVKNNSCGVDILVPTSTSGEWSDFRSNAPVCVQITNAYDCAPTTVHGHSIGGGTNGQTRNFTHDPGCTYPQVKCEDGWHIFQCQGTTWVATQNSNGICVGSGMECF